MAQKETTRRQFIKAISITAALFVFYFILPAGMPEAQKRMAVIFAFAAAFWASEIIPLYTTALLVVLLETFLLSRPGGVLGMDQSGYKVFFAPFADPVIMLFLGGFVLAAAVHKYGIDALIARLLLQLFGNKPYFVLLGFLLTTAFLSMWISNTATAALMIVMIRPLVIQLKESDPFRKALVLSVPFAANLGGIGTPVGSPPNAVAMGILAKEGIYLNFLSWMVMAVPLVIILLVITSLILYFLFPPQQRSINFSWDETREWDNSAKAVSLIMAATIALWLTSEFHKIPEAMVALLAAGSLTSLGFLSSDDFKHIEWDILVLMWGGLALGEGMERSGLTQWLVSLPLFEQHGSLLVVVFCLLAVSVSTFISNTATANLILPVAMSIQGENHIVLAVTIALSCSFAMAFPISTPPNAIAYATDMIKSRDMLKAGALVSVLSLIIMLLGFKFVLTMVLK